MDNNLATKIIQYLILFLIILIFTALLVLNWEKKPEALAQVALLETETEEYSGSTSKRSNSSSSKNTNISENKGFKTSKEKQHKAQDIEEELTQLDTEIPIYQYYEKIPEMRGVTNDRENMSFSLKIDLGYEVGDVKTLKKLSDYAIKIAGTVRQKIAAKTKLYLGDLKNRLEIERDIADIINNIIAPNPKDPARIKDVIIAEFYLHDYR